TDLRELRLQPRPYLRGAGDPRDVPAVLFHDDAGDRHRGAVQQRHAGVLPGARDATRAGKMARTGSVRRRGRHGWWGAGRLLAAARGKPPIDALTIGADRRIGPGAFRHGKDLTAQRDDMRSHDGALGDLVLLD